MRRNFNFFSSVFFCFFIVTGCNTLPQQTTSERAKSDLAKNYIRNGDPRKAAKIYQQIANRTGDSRSYYQLRALESFIASGDIQSAQSLADSIDPRFLNNEQLNQLALFHAQIFLSFGEAEQAIGKLNQINTSTLRNKYLVQYQQSKAFAYSLTGELIKSAEARLELNQWLTPDQQHENNSAILETLVLSPVNDFVNLPSFANSDLRGWVELAKAIKLKSIDPALAYKEIKIWQQTHPEHPGNIIIQEKYSPKSNLPFHRPQAIAVFLPSSGTYASAGRAIREGIMAAYRLDPRHPSIRFYDSEVTDLARLYFQAIEEGAEMIIGPLSKPNIQSLAEYIDFEIPVLALNHIEELSKANLYQFGLSPIDDSEKLTATAKFDDHQNVIIVVPDSEQGIRIGNQIKDNWEQKNGTVLELITYAPKQTDFSKIIKNALKLIEHRNPEARHKKSNRNAVSMRQDVDAIFLYAHNTIARSFNPQMKFYHAGHIPIYAMPQVYKGLPDPNLDFDLNNVIFCDIPWLFNEAYNGPLNLHALQNTWERFPTNYLRLIALGIDAYNLIDHLGSMTATPYSGTTGELSLTETNRIKRNLVCAKFIQGVPSLIGPNLRNGSGLMGRNLP